MIIRESNLRSFIGSMALKRPCQKVLLRSFHCSRIGGCCDVSGASLCGSLFAPWFGILGTILLLGSHVVVWSKSNLDLIETVVGVIASRVGEGIGVVCTPIAVELWIFVLSFTPIEVSEVICCISSWWVILCCSGLCCGCSCICDWFCECCCICNNFCCIFNNFCCGWCCICCYLTCKSSIVGQVAYFSLFGGFCECTSKVAVTLLWCGAISWSSKTHLKL